MAKLHSEQTDRLSVVVANLSNAWTPMKNPVTSERGIFGLFPGVVCPEPFDQIFEKVGAKIRLYSMFQAHRGGPANNRLVTGVMGKNVHFVARCSPAAIDGTFNIAIDLAPSTNADDDSGFPIEGVIAACEDLLGEMLRTTDGLSVFIRRQLSRASTQDRPALLAAVAGLVAEILREAASTNDQ